MVVYVARGYGALDVEGAEVVPGAGRFAALGELVCKGGKGRGVTHQSQYRVVVPEPEL